MVKLGKIVDNMVAVFNPSAAYQRAIARSAYNSAVNRLSYRNARESRLRKMRLGLGGSADQQVNQMDLFTLRETARMLDRDNTIASSILDRASEAVIDGGIQVQVVCEDKTWARDVETRFMDWWGADADLRGMRSGQQIERIAYRALKVDGDMLVQFGDDNRLMFIEADRLYTPSSRANDKKLIHGIEVDMQGRPQNYWVGERNFVNPYASKARQTFSASPIPASDCIFLFDPERFSQTRGISAFATSAGIFEDLDAFIEACVVGAKIAVSHVLFIERQQAQSARDLDGGVEVTDPEGNTRTEQVVNPGMILQGRPGEKATMVGSTQQMVQFGPFVTQLLRFVGLKFGMPLELASLDFSKTNYSSAKGSLQAAHRSFMRQHAIMFHRFKAPIARRKINQWIEEGRIQVPTKAWTLQTTPPRVISVDPQKDAQADILRVGHGMNTLRNVASQAGYNFEQLLEQRALEIEIAAGLATRIESGTGAKVDWRDLIGDTKDYKPELYKEEANGETSSQD